MIKVTGTLGRIGTPLEKFEKTRSMIENIVLSDEKIQEAVKKAEEWISEKVADFKQKGYSDEEIFSEIIVTANVKDNKIAVYSVDAKVNIPMHNISTDVRVAEYPKDIPLVSTAYTKERNEKGMEIARELETILMKEELERLRKENEELRRRISELESNDAEDP